MKFPAAAILSFLLLPLMAGAGLASPLPEHVSEYQAAKAPEGARHLCRNYPWACGKATAAPLLQETEILAAAGEVNLAVNR